MTHSYMLTTKITRNISLALTVLCNLYPVDTRRRLKVNKTSIRRQRRRIAVL